MDVGDYVIRVVLKATSNMDAEFAKFSDGIDKATDSAEGHAAAVDRSNDSLGGLIGRIGEFRQKMTEKVQALKASSAALSEHRARVNDDAAAMGRHVGILGAVGAGFRKLQGDVAGAGRSLETAKKPFHDAAQAASDLGESLGKDVGFALFIKYAQAAITGAVALGADLVALADVAIQTGAALGGAFVAAAAQAVPVMAVLGAAMQRFKLIMEAVKQSEEVEHRDRAEILQGRLAMTNAINAEANAHFALGQAQEASTASTRALSEARRAARREIEDLTAAEREAVTAARSAELAETQSRATLERKKAQGANLQELAEAENAVQSAAERTAGAHRQVGRSAEDAARARGRGVEGSTQVISAERAQTAAMHGVTTASQQLAQAQTQLAITAETANSKQAALNQTLAEMTPRERKLFEDMRTISKEIQEIMKPLADTVVGGFVNMFGRLNALIHNNAILHGLTDIAKAIAKSIEEIFGAATSDKGIKLLGSLTEDAAKSVEQLGKVFASLLPVVLAIAKAAEPLLKGWMGTAAADLEHFAKSITSLKGEKSLAAFFAEAGRSAEAVFRLLGDIVKYLLSFPGAAESGRKLLNSMADSLDRLTKWNETHGKELAPIFEASRKAAEELLHVIGFLIAEMAKKTDFSMLHVLAEIATKILIPALGTVVEIFGKLSYVVHAFLALPYVDTIIKWLAVGVMLTMGLGKISLAFKEIRAVVGGFFKLLRTGNPFAWIAVAIGVVVALNEHFHFLGETAHWVASEFEKLAKIWEGWGEVAKYASAVGAIAAALVGIHKFRGALGGLASGAKGAAGKAAAAMGLTGRDRGISPTAPLYVFVVNQTSGHGLPGPGGGGGGGPTILGPDGKPLEKAAAKEAGPIRRFLSKIPGLGKLIPEAGAGASILSKIPGLGKATGWLGEGAGFLSKVPLLKNLSRGGLAGLLAFPALELGAGALGGGLGNAASKAVNVAGYAATGAALGSFLPGPGTLVGGLAGGAFGLAQSGVLKDLFGGGGKDPSQKMAEFSKRTEDLAKNISKLSGGELRKIHDEAVKMANDPQFAKWEGPLKKISSYFTPGQQQLSQGLFTLRVGLESTSRAAGLSFGEIMKHAEDTASYFTHALPAGSAAARDALALNFEQAAADVQESMRKGKISVAAGLHDIGELMAKALEALGLSPHSAHKLAAAGVTVPQEEATIQSTTRAGLTRPGSPESSTVGGHSYQYAEGGYVRARPGGQMARLGEGGHDEVVLSSDPKHAARQSNLLGKFLSQAPHLMAAAGAYIYPFTKRLTPGRTDMGVDYPGTINAGQPIAAIGDAEVKGIISNWYAGQPYLWYELLSGPDKGRFVYVAEQITRLAKVGSKLKKGEPVAYFASSGTGIETGFSTATGQTLAQSTTGYTEGAKTPAGQQFLSFIQGLAQGKILSLPGVAGTVAAIKAPKMAGSGALQHLGQNLLNRITAGANAVIARHEGRMTPEAQGGASLSSGSNALKIMRFFEGRGLSKADAAGIVGNMQQESSLDPNAPGGGLIQGQGGRTSHGTMGQQLAGVWRELTGEYRSVLQALRGARTPQSAARVFSEQFERPGVPMLSNRERYAVEAYRKYADGSMVHAQPGGTLAVVGEGGHDEVILSADPSKKSRTQALLSRFIQRAPHVVKGFAAGVYHAPFNPLGGIQGAGRVDTASGLVNVTSQEVITEAQNVLHKLAAAFKRTGRFTKALEQRLAGVQNVQIKLLEEAQNELAAGMTKWISLTLNAWKKGKAVLTGKGADVVKAAEVNLQGLQVQYENIRTTEANIHVMLTNTRRVMNHGNAKQRAGARAALSSLEQELEKTQETGATLLQQLVQQQQAVQAAMHEKISNLATKETAGIARQQTVASALGTISGSGMGALQSVLDQQQEAVLKRQRSSLELLRRDAESTNNTPLFEQVSNEIEQLSGEIAQTSAKRVADAIAQTEAKAQASLGPLGAEGGLVPILQAQGHYKEAAGLQSDVLRRTNEVLSGQNAEFEQEKAAAAAEGNTAAVNDLTTKIATNNTTIAQNTQTIAESTNTMVSSMQSLSSAIEGSGTGAASGGISYLQKYQELYHVNTIPAQEAILRENERTLKAGREETTGHIGEEAGSIGGPVGQMLTNLTKATGAEVFTLAQGLFNSSAFKELPPATQSLIESMVSTLEGNTTATLENTKQLEELEGKLRQPQTFKSPEWEMFRSAVFTGMGGLVGPIAQSMGIPIASNPAFTGTNVMGGTASAMNAPLIGQQVLNIYAQDAPMDPAHAGRVAAWNQKTAT